ncbi:MAG: hypothetical protein ACP5E4_02835, partial [Candidatus Aenigmatarchaeota archaeon]
MKLEEEVIRLLESEHGGLSISELSRILGVSRESVTNSVYRLIGEGRIKVAKLGASKVCMAGPHLQETPAPECEAKSGAGEPQENGAGIFSEDASADPLESLPENFEAFPKELGGKEGQNEGGWQDREMPSDESKGAFYRIFAIALLLAPIFLLFGFLGHMDYTGQFFSAEGWTSYAGISGIEGDTEALRSPDGNFADLMFENGSLAPKGFVADFFVEKSGSYELVVSGESRGNFTAKVLQGGAEIYDSAFGTEIRIPMNLSIGPAEFEVLFYPKVGEEKAPRFTGFFAAVDSQSDSGDSDSEADISSGDEAASSKDPVSETSEDFDSETSEESAEQEPGGSEISEAPEDSDGGEEYSDIEPLTPEGTENEESSPDDGDSSSEGSDAETEPLAPKGPESEDVSSAPASNESDEGLSDGEDEALTDETPENETSLCETAPDGTPTNDSFTDTNETAVSGPNLTDTNESSSPPETEENLTEINESIIPPESLVVPDISGGDVSQNETAENLTGENETEEGPADASENETYELGEIYIRVDFVALVPLPDEAEQNATINETNITAPVNETNTTPINLTNTTFPVNGANMTVPTNETNLTYLNETLAEDMNLKGVNESDICSGWVQGEILIGEPVRWERNMTFPNPSNETVTKEIELSIPPDAFNITISLDGETVSCNGTLNFNISENSTLEVQIVFYTSPVEIELVEQDMNISDFLPPDAFDIELGEKKGAVRQGSEFTASGVAALPDELPKAKRKVLTLRHNSSLSYSNVAVDLEALGMGTSEKISFRSSVKGDIIWKVGGGAKKELVVDELSEAAFVLEPEYETTQNKAFVGEPVNWTLDVGNTSISYKTPAPEISGFDSPNGKKVVVASNASVHYQNVSAFIELLEIDYKPRIFHIINGSRVDVTDAPRYSVKHLDTNNNTLYDRMEWIVPQLSEQEFEIELVVLNPVEYLKDGDTWIVYFNTTGTANLTIWSPNAAWEEILEDNNLTVDEMRFLSLSCGEESVLSELVVIGEDGTYYNYTELKANESIKPKKFHIPDYSCNGKTSSLKNYMNIAGYAELVFEFKNQNFTVIDYAYDPSTLAFVPPTEANATTIYERNWTRVNISIEEQNLEAFKFNWNTTNYTFYDDSLVLALNLNNNSDIGENETYAVDISKYGNDGTFKGAGEPNWTASGRFGS